MRSVVQTTDYAAYVSAWDGVARAGLRHLNLDAWAAGRRYLSLTGVVLNAAEAAQLRNLTVHFSTLLDAAVDGILNDPDWWSSLAWPWPAIELARQEPAHPGGRASLYGRFDCLLDAAGTWQVVEYNADTPSGAAKPQASSLRSRTAMRPCEDSAADFRGCSSAPCASALSIIQYRTAGSASFRRTPGWKTWLKRHGWPGSCVALEYRRSWAT